MGSLFSKPEPKCACAKHNTNSDMRRPSKPLAPSAPTNPNLGGQSLASDVVADNSMNINIANPEGMRSYTSNDPFLQHVASRSRPGLLDHTMRTRSVGYSQTADRYGSDSMEADISSDPKPRGYNLRHFPQTPHLQFSQMRDDM